jgi:hypothetical protein
LCTAIWRGRIWERAGNERHAAESGEGMDKDIEGAVNRKMEKMGEGFVISVRHSMPGVGCVMICCCSDCLSDAVVGYDAVLGV